MFNFGEKHYEVTKYFGINTGSFECNLRKFITYLFLELSVAEAVKIQYQQDFSSTLEQI